MAQIWHHSRRTQARYHIHLSVIFFLAPGLAAFQLLNPKSWVMVLTATAAISSDLGGVTSLAVLAVIFTAVTTVCLVLWALAGAAVANFITAPAVKRSFDRTMGGLLIASAFLLLV